MKKVRTLILLLLILLMLPVSVLAAGEQEDNNTYDMATSMGVNKKISGAITDGEDRDWYVFRLSEAGVISVQFDHNILPSQDIYWYVEIFGKDGVTGVTGNQTRWSVPGNTNLLTPQIGLDAGTYYIRITPHSSDRCDTGNYSLCVNATYTSAWETENNGSTADSDTIRVNTACQGTICEKEDVDWYRFKLNEDGYVSIDLEHVTLSSTHFYWQMVVYQPDGVTYFDGVDDYWNIKGNENLQTDQIGLAAGTYYIRIRPYDRDRFDSGEYTLRVNYTQSDVWETEINNQTAKADDIRINTDHFGAISGAHDVDWYKVTLPRQGYITVRMDHEVLSSKDVYWYIYLYQTDGVTGIYGEDTRWKVLGNENWASSSIGLEPGTYYIRITPYGTDRFSTATYSLRIDFQASKRWETEINKTPESADPISVNTDHFSAINDMHDQDWYRFELNTLSRVSLKFTHDADSGTEEYWQLLLYEGDGVTQIGETAVVKGNVAESSFSFGGLSAGSYYVQVKSWSVDKYATSPYTLRVSEEHVHWYSQWVTTREPRCMTTGVEQGSCIYCGLSSVRILPAVGHSFGQWEVLRDSSCSEEGEDVRACAVCSFREYRPIECKPHTYGEPVQVDGSILNCPIIYHETCEDCGAVRETEDNRYSWVTPAILTGLAVIAIITGLVLIFINRRRLFKTSFVCPFCFEQHRMSRAQFRCVNTLCVDVLDLEMTRYESGSLDMPKVGKPTFRGRRIRRGPRFVPSACDCPECGHTSHKVICPSCHNPLPESTLMGEDMIISVLGGRDSGKSHFIGVVIRELIDRIIPGFDGSFEGFDDTMDRYERHFGKKLYVDMQRLDQTNSSMTDVDNGAYRPMIFSLKFQTGSRLRPVRYYTLAIFDAAGEDLTDEDTMNTVNRYICKSSGIVFLLDPMHYKAVTAQLDDDVVSRASSVSGKRSVRPEEILTRVSNLIRNDRNLPSAAKIDVPVAVVFSKFDTIADIVPKHSVVHEVSPHCRDKAFDQNDAYNVSEEVSGLLQTWGAGTFLAQLGVNYREYACFAVSALGMENNPTEDMRIKRPRPHRIEDPVLWLLAKLRVIRSKS